MYKDFKVLLPRARGESRLVVVIFLDVRGFSSFAKIAESSEAALFLRTVYVKILDEYFPEATFFKPTGDGLLVIFDYENEDSLRDIVNASIKTSLKLVENFGELTKADPMINFQVPSALGIGIARGAATALISGEQVLDYSGRPLNLASRLMDLARPLGVVFSETLGYDLVDDELASQFSEASAYIKGIAEDEPTTVYIATDTVRLPEASKHPLNRYNKKNGYEEETTFKNLQERGNFLHKLPDKPVDTNSIVVYVETPTATAAGRRNTRINQSLHFPGIYLQRQGKHFARVDYEDIAKKLKSRGVKATWPVKIIVEYSVYPDT